MDILNFLNRYDLTHVNEEDLLKQGFSLEEISKLVVCGALRKTSFSEVYQISKIRVQSLIIEKLLQKKDSISRKTLISSGVTDNAIQLMVKEGKLYSVKRGVYAFLSKEESKKEDIKKDLSSLLLEAIQTNDLSLALQILETTEKEEFISLSKTLWKWILTRELSNSVGTVFLKESDAIILQDTALKSDSSYEEKSISDFTQNPILEEADIRDNLACQEEENNHDNSLSLSKEELFRLYKDNQKENPIAARDFLLEYKKLCELDGEVFDYRKLSYINQDICNLGIPFDQLEKETLLKIEINALIRKELNHKELRELRQKIEEFDYLYQKRGVATDVYYGAYYQKCKKYEEAICHFNSVLEKEPWNFYARNRLCYIYRSLKMFDKAEETVEQHVFYYPYDISSKIYLGKCYASSFKISKIRKLTETPFKEDTEDKRYFLLNMVTLMKNEIDSYKMLLETNPNSHKYWCRRIRRLEMELFYYQELLGIEANLDSISVSDFDVDVLKQYDDEVFQVISGEDNSFKPKELESYVKNLEVSSDQKALLYIAGAKIMFLNKFTSYGDRYLKLASQLDMDDQFTKEQYMECVRNKKIYLHK